jgi:hypothetical protein
MQRTIGGELWTFGVTQVSQEFKTFLHTWEKRLVGLHSVAIWINFQPMFDYDFGWWYIHVDLLVGKKYRKCKFRIYLCDNFQSWIVSVCQCKKSKCLAKNNDIIGPYCSWVGAYMRIKALSDSFVD